MRTAVTDGVTALLARVSKKTSYHKDDVKVIVYTLFDELRAMMEENATRRIYFERFGSFDMGVLRERKVYDFQKKEWRLAPARYTPKMTFNRQMVLNIKKIHVKNG